MEHGAIDLHKKESQVRILTERRGDRSAHSHDA
jgi:hypothetical protein